MRYWLNRCLETIPLLLGISLIAFTIFRLSPRDPTGLLVDPTLTSSEERAEVRRQLGLDDPFFVQYGRTMWGLATGELRSFKSKQPTLAIVRDAFPTSALVGGLGIVASIGFALVFGTLACRRPGGWVDR